jgi:hypothetical protein
MSFKSYELLIELLLYYYWRKYVFLPLLSYFTATKPLGGEKGGPGLHKEG